MGFFQKRISRGLLAARLFARYKAALPPP